MLACCEISSVLSRFPIGLPQRGCNKWGLKGCLAALPGNQPKSTFFARFLPFSPFSGGCEEHLGNPENGEKGLFPQIASDLRKPPSLNPPHLQHSNPSKASLVGGEEDEAQMKASWPTLTFCTVPYREKTCQASKSAGTSVGQNKVIPPPTHQHQCTTTKLRENFLYLEGL